MTPRQLLQRSALLARVNARIAAMSAENDHARLAGKFPAYDEASFEKIIDELDAIALSLCEVPA